MKFILILRDPVLRAFSGYNYSIRNGYLNKNISFIDACKNEKKIKNSTDIVLKNNKCNILRSKYFYNLQYWQKFFPKENFLVLQTTDLNNKLAYVFNQICNFLGVENEEVKFDKKEKNKAFRVRSKRLQQLRVNRNNPTRRFLKKIIPPFVNTFMIKSRIVKNLQI